MEYTIIGGPLFGKHGQYFTEMTIKKLLKDQKNGWTLEVAGLTEEHLCLPHYDDGDDLVSFDDLDTICPFAQRGLFENEATLKWGALLVSYDEEEEVIRRYKWMRTIRTATFIFRRRENNVIKRTWIFYDTKPLHVERDAFDDDGVTIEFRFDRFEAI